MSGRTSLLSASHVRQSPTPVLVGGPPRQTACSSEATVTEVRDELGDLREIHVTCECGKVTVVSCRYEGDAA